MSPSLSDTESISILSDLSQPVSMSTVSSTVAPYRRSQYYNEMVVFRVQDTLFRESKRYFAANSQFFRDLFDKASSSAEGTPSLPAGQLDEKPLLLEDVTVDDFERLLSIISPITPHEQTTLSTDEWKSVMKLSTKWGMTSLRKHCIKHLSPLPSDMSITSKILFARECLAADWLVDAYNQLAQRQETISEEEAVIIGIQSAIRMLRAREKWVIDKESQAGEIYNSYTGGYSKTVQYVVNDRTSYDYRANIRLLFQDEIKSLQ